MLEICDPGSVNPEVKLPVFIGPVKWASTYSLHSMKSETSTLKGNPKSDLLELNF